MRILLDACIPVDFRHDLTGLGQVETARYPGLDHLSNGDLRDAMHGPFDVLITVDKSLRYQQAIQGRPISVIVVAAPSNALVHLLPRVPAIATALAATQPGTVVEI